MNQINQAIGAPYIQNNFNINFGVPGNELNILASNSKQYNTQSNLPPLNLTKNEARNKLNNSLIQQKNKEYIERQSSLYQTNNNLQNSMQSNSKSLKILGDSLIKKKEISIQSILNQTGSFKELKAVHPKKQVEIVVHSINEKQKNIIYEYKNLSSLQKTDSFQDTLSQEKESGLLIKQQKIMLPQLHIGFQNQDQVQNLSKMKNQKQNVKLRNQTIQDTIQTQNTSAQLSNKQNKVQLPVTFNNTIMTNSTDKEIQNLHNNIILTNQQNRSSSVIHSYKKSFNQKKDSNEYQEDMQKKGNSNFKASLIFNQLQNSSSDSKLITKKVENADLSKILNAQNIQFQSEGRVNPQNQANEYGIVQLRNFQIPQLPLSQQEIKKNALNLSKSQANAQPSHKDQKAQQIYNPYAKLQENNDKLQERSNQIDKKLEKIKINSNQSQQVTIELKSKKLVIKGRVPLNKMDANQKGVQNSYGIFGESPFMNNSAVKGIQIPKSSSQSSKASKESAINQSNK